MKLKKLEVNSFAGISPDSPILLDFTQSNFLHVTGDQGVGKTSLINALLVACGQLSRTEKDFINLDSGGIDINFEFVGKDRLTYVVRCTKSAFKLTYEGALVAEPIAKMKELLGVVGCSPMEVKSKSLREILKWLSSYSSKSLEEYEADMKKFKDSMKAHQQTRAAANKTVLSLTQWLEAEPLFHKWDESAKKYTKAIDIEELSTELKVSGNKSDQLVRAREKLRGQKESRVKIQEQLDELNEQMEELNQRIGIGEDFVEKNKEASKEYDEVKSRYDNAYKEMSAYNMWQQVKEKKKEKDEFEKVSKKADASEKEIIQKVKDLQTEILPDIKGVSLITEDYTEAGVSYKEGLYWNNRNVAQLSESEWWGIVMAIWKKYKVRIVVIDNFSSLGSKAADLLSGLAKDGAFILAAEMDRQQKTLQITYE